MQLTGHKIPVHDITIATKFYRDQLGFIILFEAEEYGWASIEKDGINLGLYVTGKGGGTRQPGGSIDFSFALTELDSYHATLKTNGVTVSDIITTNDGLQLFELVDPSGNELTFRQISQ